ncbi:unnamed protein product [Protopolystoma xenopodis]|uniref:Uncharacterized protein n=1 Tax=Protopolystoma xenopodis TaxID=117903 RepID=A0A448X288_9PLAT|nr:unnamed protein product [Protopolystoma xenopodis]
MWGDAAETDAAIVTIRSHVTKCIVPVSTFIIFSPSSVPDEEQVVEIPDEETGKKKKRRWWRRKKRTLTPLERRERERAKRRKKRAGPILLQKLVRPQQTLPANQSPLQVPF